MHDTTLDDPVLPSPDPARADDGWLRYSVERAASIGLLLMLATIAAIAKHRAYRTLLGAGLVATNLAMALALVMLCRKRRPTFGEWGLFACCAVTLATTIVLALLSAHGSFPVDE